MATHITVPAKRQANQVATSREYYQKHVFERGNNHTGSYLTQATVLLYDDILRYQRGFKYTHGLTAAMVDAFDYNDFAGNVLWFMDELVGMESDWNPKAEPLPSPSNPNPTAYGYVQFTKASIATAITIYANHIERFNKRKDTRDWKPWKIPKGAIIYTPRWLIDLTIAVDKQSDDMPGPNYKHKYELNKLTYDQTVALSFIYLHREGAKDYNFVQLAKGDVTAAKEIYVNKHHTDPDTATLLRLNVTIQPGRDITGAKIAGTDPGFFRIHYVPATTIISLVKQMPIVQGANLLYNTISNQIMDSKYKDTASKFKSWFGL